LGCSPLRVGWKGGHCTSSKSPEYALVNMGEKIDDKDSNTLTIKRSVEDKL